MDKNILEVKNYYNENVLKEWSRLDEHPFEFKITTKMMDKYIKSGDKILDIGGGPGKYSLYYARKGCDVTLVDLSEENIAFALNKADELGLKLKAMVGNAMDIDKIVNEEYDHVFIMGPMYHLLKEDDRETVMKAALSKLKTGGNIYVSFIMLFAGVIYLMKNMPEHILNLDAAEIECFECVNSNIPFSGEAFTKAHFSTYDEILYLMNKFDLRKLNIFGQESILAPCENVILKHSKEVQDKWGDIGFNLCEREDFLSYSEHLMYIGKK